MRARVILCSCFEVLVRLSATALCARRLGMISHQCLLVSDLTLRAEKEDSASNKLSHSDDKDYAPSNVLCLELVTMQKHIDAA